MPASHARHRQSALGLHALACEPAPGIDANPGKPASGVRKASAKIRARAHGKPGGTVEIQNLASHPAFPQPKNRCGASVAAVSANSAGSASATEGVAADGGEPQRRSNLTPAAWKRDVNTQPRPTAALPRTVIRSSRRDGGACASALRMIVRLGARPRGRHARHDGVFRGGRRPAPL
jgi:hypothetical protein